MVLGGQYVVVTVSWLSEKNIYIYIERKGGQGGLFLERENKGNNEEDAACKL